MDFTFCFCVKIVFEALCKTMCNRSKYILQFYHKTLSILYELFAVVMHDIF